MSIKNDKWISEQIEKGMIANATPVLTTKGVMSFGVSSFGYDVTLGETMKILYRGTLVNPKAPTSDNWCDLPLNDAGVFVIPPHSFALGYSNEVFCLPNNITGLVFPKSSYARCGLNCFQTVLEAGWEGQITLEFANNTHLPILLYPNEGCAQIIFLEGDPCLKSYAARKGKYQHQMGVTLSKVSDD